jgi:Short C-terminal domain
LLAVTEYPFLEIFWTILIFFSFFIWIWLLFVVFADIFRRSDIGGWGKTGWIIFVIILPYLVAEHKGMTERTIAQQNEAKASMDEYVRETAGGSDPTQQIAKASELLKSGAITQAEFDAIKAKALA